MHRLELGPFDHIQTSPEATVGGELPHGRKTIKHIAEYFATALWLSAGRLLADQVYNPGRPYCL